MMRQLVDFQAGEGYCGSETVSPTIAKERRRDSQAGGRLAVAARQSSSTSPSSQLPAEIFAAFGARGFAPPANLAQLKKAKPKNVRKPRAKKKQLTKRQQQQKDDDAMLEEGSATDAAADVASDAMVTSAAKKPAAKNAKRSASKNNATAAAANKKQKPGGGQTTLSQYACTARHAARADVLEASSVRPKRKGAGTGGASERYAKDDERGTERQKIVQDGGGGEWANAMVVGPVRMSRRRAAGPVLCPGCGKDLFGRDACACTL